MLFLNHGFSVSNTIRQVVTQNAEVSGYVILTYTIPMMLIDLRMFSRSSFLNGLV